MTSYASHAGRAAVAAGCLLLTACPTHAHAIIGDRLFPATLAIDDPGVTDELSLPTFARTIGSDGTREHDYGFELDKTIVPGFEIIVGDTYSRFSDGTRGLQNLELGAKYQLYGNAPHEVLVAIGALVGDRRHRRERLLRHVLDDRPAGLFRQRVRRPADLARRPAAVRRDRTDRPRHPHAALHPGSLTTEVTVTGAPPALQTETAEVNSEISQTQLNALPITSSAGRNYQALYTIIPGASAVQEKNSTSANPSRSMSVNINGNSYNGNTTRIDGAVNYYGWLPYLIAYVPPADDIENVSFTTNAFTAEQGQAGGAAIKISTKSGGSKFHGGGWEYYQDAAINAKPYTYTAKGPVPKYVFHQFGFNIGGPVFVPRILTGKKKLFFFENFERTTQRKLISGTFTVPTADMLGGDFTLASPYVTLYDPQPGGVPQTGAGTANGYLLPSARATTFMSEYGCDCIPAARQSSAAATMLALLQPVAGKLAAPSAASLSQGMANDFLATGTYAYNRNTSDSKIDYMPSESTHIFGKYSIEPFTNHRSPGPGRCWRNYHGRRTAGRHCRAHPKCGSWSEPRREGQPRSRRRFWVHAPALRGAVLD